MPFAFEPSLSLGVPSTMLDLTMAELAINLNRAVKCALDLHVDPGS